MYLTRHLVVYTRWDCELESELIDYVSLTKQADEFSRSVTVSLSSKESSISKRSVVKSRAGKLKVSHRDSNDDSKNI